MSTDKFPVPLAIDESTINFLLYRLEQSIIRKIAEDCRSYQDDDSNDEAECEAMKQIGRLAAKMYNSYSIFKIDEKF